MQRRSRGFTLVEQLAAIAIAGSASVAALPALVEFRAQAEQTALASLAAAAGSAMVLNQAGCLVTQQRPVPGKCEAVDDCQQVQPRAQRLLLVDLPAGAPPLDRLGDLGERRIGVVSGTLGGAVAMGWKQGALRSRLVSLGQRENPLDELSTAPAVGATRRFDGVLLPLALFDGWMVQHPRAPLVAAGWQRSIGVNLGFVTLASDTTVRPALDAVISRALADGSLPRWAAEEGVTWSAPGQPEVTRGPNLADLTSD